MIRRWLFRRGFRAGYIECLRGCPRETDPETSYGVGYRLGVIAYCLSQDFDEAMATAERSVFGR